jgi:nicotinamide-nucleotide amidase
MRPVTESYARLQAQQVREQLSATWGVAENGAAGPAPNRYGDAPGSACVAVTGPVERTVRVNTGDAERLSNMYAFATAALELLEQALGPRPEK